MKPRTSTRSGSVVPTKSSILTRVDYHTGTRKPEYVPTTDDMSQPSLLSEPDSTLQPAVGSQSITEQSSMLPHDPLAISPANPPKKRGRPPKNLKNDATALPSPSVQISRELKQTSSPVVCTPVSTVNKSNRRSLKSPGSLLPQLTSDDVHPPPYSAAEDSQVFFSPQGASTTPSTSDSLPRKRVPKVNKRYLTESSFAGQSDVDKRNESTPASRKKVSNKSQRADLSVEMKSEATYSVANPKEQTSRTGSEPKKRGRKRKNSPVNENGKSPMEATPPPTPLSIRPLSASLDLNVSSSTPKRGRPRKLQQEMSQPDCDSPASGKKAKLDGTSSEREGLSSSPGGTPRSERKVICGVCDKEMTDTAFTYHKYSVHYGLARLKGKSQEFSENEKRHELKRTIEKLKKLTCQKPGCRASFTTVIGYDYHEKRCGMDPENLLVECPVCGKRVMALPPHLKIHEKATETPKCKKEIVVESPVTPGTKSRRAAAHKAATRLREITDDINDTPASNKTSQFIVEPKPLKVTNSIIARWKKEIAEKASACCRFPSCSFTSDTIETLKEHHAQCEIGIKCRAFTCVKCSFRSELKEAIVEHVLSAHISEEEDAAFRLNGDSDNGESDDESVDENISADEDLSSEGEGDRKVPDEGRKSIPQNTKTLSKAYGLCATVLTQFKSQSTPPTISEGLAQFHKANYTFDGWLFDHWKPVFEKSSDHSRYLPSLEKSVSFARRTCSPPELFPRTIEKHDEIQLMRFESTLQNDVPVFFCGGRIQSAAWCPLPVTTSGKCLGERDQYLAVTVFPEEYRERSVSESTFECASAIQFWNCGKLPNVRSGQEEGPHLSAPSLEFCLAHDHGRVWSLAWCPSGGYHDSRLGLIAAACSDGTVRVFSVPNPATFHDNASTKPTFVKVTASATLALPVKDQSECTSVCWDQSLGHKHIVAGFANGVVALWDLTTKSPILLTGGVVHPVWSFFAHVSVITAVSLSPHFTGARFVATASMDRTVKLWDRFDPALPINWIRRSRITHLTWRHHWPGVLVGMEDSCALFRTTTMFHDFGYTGNKQILLPQNSVVWSTTENPYLDMIAHSTDAGEVLVYVSHLAVIDADEKKLRKSRKLILRTDLVDNTSKTFLNRMDKKYMSNPKKADTKVKPTEKTDKSYSIIYNHVNMVGRPIDSKNQQPGPNPNCDNMDLLIPCDQPITSINKILFNPNFESHSWMCVCGENGLVQLLHVNSQSIPKVADSYTQEIEK